jgi:ABC-type transporter Mla subunit MlaD
MARTQNFKVGLFVIAAVVILVGTVLLVAGIKLAEPQDRYSVRFDESVSGLDPGSPVKFRGVRVGSVEELLIPEDDITKVEVWIGIKEGTPVKTDTRARLQAIGITGLMYVELFGGSVAADNLPVGERIEAEMSFLGDLTDRASSVAQKADQLLSNMIVITDKEEFDNLRIKLAELQDKLSHNSDQLQALLEVSTSAATRFDTTLAFTNRMLIRNELRIDRSLADLEGSLSEMHTLLREFNEGDVVDNINTTAQAASDMMIDLRTLVSSNRRTVSETLANLRETSANMNQFSRTVKEKPSLLIRSNTPDQRRLPESD